MAYVLQADQLSEDREEAVKMIAGCGADLVVLDPFHQSWEFETGRWTAGEIAKIRGASPGRKVVAYISIGEAENYRQYWSKEWDPDEDGKPDQGAPDFLEKVNPDWWGNYKVRYWSKDWRKIVLDEIAQIMKQDFDGLYLDIVDAFEYFEYDPKTDSYLDRKKNKETKNSYREDMVELVQAIADFSRTGKKDFLIIPQNAVQLLEIKDYLKIIDAVGVEDLFTEGDKYQDKEDVKYRMAFLDRMKKAKKPVLLIEYCKERRVQDRVMREAAKYGLVLLITDRELKSLGSIKPPEKPVDQPKPDEGKPDGRKPEEGTEEKNDAGAKEEMKEDEKEEKEEPPTDPFALLSREKSTPLGASLKTRGANTLLAYAAASEAEEKWIPLDMSERKWSEAYFPGEDEKSSREAPEEFRRLDSYRDSGLGDVLSAGPWLHGVWSLRWDYKEKFPFARFRIKGLYKTEDVGPMQICLRVKYFKGGEELSKQSWEQISPTNGAWKELDIARPIAYPEADSMQIGLGLASHTKGKLHFAKIAVSEIKDVQSVFREIPEVGLEPRDLSFLTGKKSDRFRIEGRGDSWTLVAPDGTPFYSIGSMAPWDYMPPGKLVDFVERLRAGGFNSIAAWMDLDQFVGKDFLEEFGRRKLPPMPIFHTIETYGDEDRINSLLLRDENGATNTGEISHAFPDPFDPEFRKYYRELVAKELPLAKDNPHFIAWMQDNELSHANLHRCVFSKHASAKFVEFLKGRYPEGIKKLNGEWTANFASFEQIIQRKFVPEYSSGTVYDDYHGFSRLMVSEYAKFALETFRELDPGRLVFSNRMMHDPDDLKYADLYGGFDAVALNFYPANFAYGLDDEERLFIAEVHKRSGRPVIITEWSVPAEDSGLYGKRKSPKMDWSWAELLPDQKIRARQAALVSREFHNMPFILGSHWFMFMDADDKRRKANRGLYKADKKTPWTELLDALSKSNLEILAAHHN